MALKSTQEKFIHELADVYDAEHQFSQAMEQMRKQATDSTLQKLLATHLDETRQQIKTLEEVYSLLNEKPKRQTCDGAKGIVTEGQKSVREAQEDALRDCVIGAAVDKAEHYEIASYKGLIDGAELMGEQKIVKLIDGIFKQEAKMAADLEKSSPALLQKAAKVEAGKA